MALRTSRASMRIALPPRISLGLSLSESDSSLPSTPNPHTPNPYEYGFSEELGAQHDRNALDFVGLQMCSSMTGSKRARSEEEDRVEPEWTVEEMDVLQSTLMHPFRPLSASYPPGDLPPPSAIDELTNQILAFAFRTSPIRHTSPTEQTWKHSWDATRRKLFEFALTESKFGLDAVDRKMDRKPQRPGLRRVDSMDFLDQEEDRSDTGRAIRLSTSLQNSAKQEPLIISRSPSLGSSLGERHSPGPAPMCATITLTPASPDGPLPRQRSSIRGPNPRPVRPTSLLQRGRSFTASDLEAEVETAPSTSALMLGHGLSSSPTEEITLPRSPVKEISLPLSLAKEPRITRSQSSSAMLNSHVARDTFLATAPSTTDRAVLAMPLSIEMISKPRPISNWSDSEDDRPAKPRVVKKMKSSSRGKGINIKGSDLMGGLRSPFEEKVFRF